MRHLAHGLCLCPSNRNKYITPRLMKSPVSTFLFTTKDEEGWAGDPILALRKRGRTIGVGGPESRVKADGSRSRGGEN